MNKEKHILTYRKFMFMYGILSVLYVLEHFESVEDYEECQKIIDAITEQENRLDCVLPKRVNKEAINEVIEGYKPFGMTGVNAVENSKYYAEHILKELLTLQDLSQEIESIKNLKRP